jgi:HD-like signal output (HDOD) protein
LEAETVFKWLSSLFASPAPPPTSSPRPSPAPDGVVATQSEPAPPAGDRILAPHEVEFLAGLVEPPPHQTPEELTKDDQLFLAGILKRWHAHKLEMPILPKVAIRLGAMLRKDDLSVTEIVALLDTDPALSVEVLRTANSAFYGSTVQTTSINEAILRIGAKRLQGILIMAHMKAKVLRGGSFQGKAELLMDLAMPLGDLAGTLARRNGVHSELCFVRGMLLHVEHLVILGALADVSRDHKRALVPTAGALQQAFDRFGRDIRTAVAAAWDLEDILIGSGDDLAEEYAGLRHALVWRWLGRPLPQLPHVDAEVLKGAMAGITPRIAEDCAA